jgi:AraC family transcriptional regulator
MQLLRPDEVPRWAPGTTLLASDHLGWRDVTLRSYRFGWSDIELPPLRDFVIIAYARGTTPMNRCLENRWTEETMLPGDVSLLTRAEQSHWHWTSNIDVVQVYLAPRLLAKVSNEVFERSIEDVRLLDVLKTRDPVLHRGAFAIADEVTSQGIGGRLYVEAVTNQLAVHILRNYATVSFRASKGTPGLSAVKARLLLDYVENHLDHSISLDDLAGMASVSSWHFLRLFKERFGCTPHAWVLGRRVERAKELLRCSDLPIKDIAARTGFADQAHLTHVFHRMLRTTPAAYRGPSTSR